MSKSNITAYGRILFSMTSRAFFIHSLVLSAGLRYLGAVVMGVYNTGGLNSTFGALDRGVSVTGRPGGRAFDCNAVSFGFSSAETFARFAL